MRIIFGLLFLLLLFPFFMAFIEMGGNFIHASDIFWPVILGVVIGIILEAVLFRKIPWLETFEHELTHSLVALAFLRRIRDFRVTSRSGGHMKYENGFGGDFGNELIGLAPYYLPTFTFLSALIRPFLGETAFPWFDVWIGFTFGFHLWSTIEETRQNWTSRPSCDLEGKVSRTDIGKRGLAYSAILIASLTLTTHGVILALMLKRWGGFSAWGRSVGRIVQTEVNFIFDFIRRLI